MRMEETRGVCRCEKHRGQTIMTELHFKIENDADAAWLAELAEAVKQRALEAGSYIMAIDAATIQRRLREYKAARNN